MRAPRSRRRWMRPALMSVAVAVAAAFANVALLGSVGEDRIGRLRPVDPTQSSARQTTTTPAPQTTATPAPRTTATPAPQATPAPTTTDDDDDSSGHREDRERSEDSDDD